MKSNNRKTNVSWLRRLVVYFLLIFLVGFSAGVVYLHRLIDEGKAKIQLENAFSDFLRRNLTIQEIGWTILPRPSLIGYGVVLWEEKGLPIWHLTGAIAYQTKYHLSSSDRDFFVVNIPTRLETDNLYGDIDSKLINCIYSDNAQLV